MGVAFFLCVQTWKSRPAGGGVPGLLGVVVGWKTVKRPFESGGAFKGSLLCLLSCGLLFGVGGFLLSHNLPVAVPSALAGLASGFGMGPGVSLLL